jgi:serine/threonine protein kinase
MTTRYVALGPLLSGEGSRAFLGLRIVDGVASPCALVWAPEQVVCEPELVERLRRETAHAERLRHPNIARVFGLIEVDEGLARVVEFADGESLRRILDVLQALPPPLAARIVVDAALGVQYAHLTGNPDGTPLVHGDLRPETVLVSYSGVTKVTGYGALSVAPKELGGKRVMGRRTHCAPEQILGGRYAVSPRTDVYLLGSLLYEAISGEIPFQGDKDFEHAVVTKEPLLLKSELFPPKLWPVIRRAMAKKGDLRFETPQAFSEMVEEAMGGLPPRSELADFLEHSFAADETRNTRRRELEDGIQEWVVRQGLRLASPVVAMGPQPAAPPESSPAGTALTAANLGPSPGDPDSAKAELISAVPVEPERPSPLSPRPVAVEPSPSIPEGEAPQVERAAGDRAAPRSARRGVPAWVVTGLLVALASAAAVLWVNRQKAQPATTSSAAPSQPEAAPRASAQPPSPKPGARGAGESATRKRATAGLPPRKKLGTGTVTVNAPDGCEVRIDGRLVGTAPLEGPVTVFEGKHRIQVSSGGARWRQAFSITNGGSVTADVHFEEPKAP